MTTDPPSRASTPRLRTRGLRFLNRRRPVLARLAGWSLLEAGQTFLFGYALARALDDGFLAGDTTGGLGWLAAAAVAVAAGAYGTGRVFRAVSELVEPLRDSLVRRVVGRALAEADHGAVSRLTHQVEIARDTFAGLVMVSRSFVFTAAGALAGLASLAPALLLVVVPPLVLGLALFLVTLRPMARRQETFLVADEAVAEVLDATAAGLRDIAAAGAESRTAVGADARFDAEYRAARTLARWGVVRVLAVAVAGRLPVVLLLLTAPWLLRRGVTPGDLVGALTYLMYALVPALQSLMQALGTAGSRLTVVLRRLTDGGPGPSVSQDAPATGPSGADALPDARAGAPWGEAPSGSAGRERPAVELRGVTFAYGPHAEPVFRGLDLAVPAGGRLTVVGPSGIGKSTLTALVAGLLVPDAGEVLLRGEPVRAAAHLRALVPQEAYVFSGALRDNLTYLCPDPPPDSAVLASARAVGAYDLLLRLGGLDAVVTPGRLSAGERQLIALARSHLAPVGVVLLDEATCHLDPAAEARAERAFAERPGTTLIVVAHRISSARRADRVLVMDGTHALCGTHDELIRRSALYRDLAGGWSEPAGALGDAYGVHAVAGPGLAGDRGHVVAHRAVGQVQAVGDLGDTRPLGGQ
ncbi:ATP-binding cassette domain-containing protein [Streptomyces chryseus]|uniref:ATP-binding cassette domain-containing protein n=1 Tax=Streptomyces chryseus TaxID=68186 RepID=UPI0016763178|nr:ABC transporter ATP-binding protein [Streptomyces chryseus]GGX12339.1 ABC transporter ATP-binding protein [Streptomyces chryseus]